MKKNEIEVIAPNGARMRINLKDIDGFYFNLARPDECRIKIIGCEIKPDDESIKKIREFYKSINSDI